MTPKAYEILGRIVWRAKDTMPDWRIVMMFIVHYGLTEEECAEIMLALGESEAGDGE